MAEKDDKRKRRNKGKDTGKGKDKDRDRRKANAARAEGKRRGKDEKHDKRGKHGKKGKDTNSAKDARRRQQVAADASPDLDAASVVVPSDLADAERPLPLLPAADLPPQVAAQADQDDAPASADADSITDHDAGIIETGKVAADAATKAARKAAEKAARRERKAARKQERRASKAQATAPTGASLSSGEAANDAAELAAAAAQEVAEQPTAHISVDGVVEVVIEAIVSRDGAAIASVQVLHEGGDVVAPEDADGASDAAAEVSAYVSADEAAAAETEAAQVATGDAADAGADAEAVRAIADVAADVLSAADAPLAAVGATSTFATTDDSASADVVGIADDVAADAVPVTAEEIAAVEAFPAAASTPADAMHADDAVSDADTPAAHAGDVADDDVGLDAAPVTAEEAAMVAADEVPVDTDAADAAAGFVTVSAAATDDSASGIAPADVDGAAAEDVEPASASLPVGDDAATDAAVGTDALEVAGQAQDDVAHVADASTATPASAPDALSDDDLYLFNEGRHLQLYHRLGAHRETRGDVDGWRFAVWAPNAEQVAVVGDFNAWDAGAHPLAPLRDSGIWSGFVAGAQTGQVYKFTIVSRTGEVLQKADPFATHAEVPPLTGSVLWEADYIWSDGDWMAQRAARNAADAPISIYELHPGSWRHRLGEGNRWLTYRELAEPLADHLTTMGFTHVEFLPLMEHPFYGSWGYQSTGYFAPTSRYGSPQDLMYLIDLLHQRGIGVILDWVPSHFPDDPHGLARFDGTHLFEHADPRQGFHPDWGSMIFNYGRNEVRSFLLSSAMYWLDVFHVDGIRVDAVASMLYLDYSREPGEWIPNQFGGRENLEAVEFLRQLNTDVYGRFPDVQIIAEESTAWPGVSRPVYDGGLGFGMKWDMGWMHDTLEYFSRDPIHRRFHHDELTFRMVYAFNEAFVLPFSHDEVVHGKGSMLSKQAGDTWQQFANLRLLYTYMYAQPGKKLLFMGSEFGTRVEWNHEASLNWDESRADPHRGISHLVGDLNRLVCAEPALHRLDFAPSGFAWLEATDADNSVLAFLRTGGTPGDELLCIFNLTPVPRYGYRIGAPQAGFWSELFNSDAGTYWGSGVGNLGGVHAEPTPWHGQPYSLPLTLPPLAGVIMRWSGDSAN